MSLLFIDSCNHYNLATMNQKWDLSSDIRFESKRGRRGAL